MSKEDSTPKAIYVAPSWCPICRTELSCIDDEGQPVGMWMEESSEGSLAMTTCPSCGVSFGVSPMPSSPEELALALAHAEMMKVSGREH